MREKNKMQLEEPFFSHGKIKVKSIIHVLRDCPPTFVILTNVVKLNMRDSFVTSNIKKNEY